ncbi:MAG TPA: nuclear transport factor 2 family protein [Steroidobacteraceae bacterium]|nr:nuclear transport factor 2 family protein [Steroidobacteraceae bacterium]
MRMSGWSFAVLAIFAGLASAETPEPEHDRQAVAELDSAYQAAVKRNDAAAMARILHPHMVLVVGSGGVSTGEDLLKSARDADAIYDHQEEVPGTQTVRVWGDTAVVTAQLWLSGTRHGTAFDRHLWFSDTYVRTPEGWRYAFGQASLALPNDASRAAPTPAGR